MKQIIIDTYPIYGINETIKKLNLTEYEKSSVQHQAQILHLKRTGKYFTENEIQYLKDNYATKTVDEIANYFNKSKEVIIHKASSLGLSNDIFYYSYNDIIFIKDNYNKLSNQELSDKLGKTLSGIETKIYKLGLTEDNSWTNEEIKILKNVYPYYTNKKISKDFLIKRNATSIATMAHKFDLVKSKEKSVKWYNKDDMTKQLKIVSEKLGRPPYTSELKMYNLPSSKTFNHYFNMSYRDICESIGLIPNYQLFGKSIHCQANDGTECASKSEQIVTNYLIEHNLNFTKEDYYKDYIKDKRCKSKRFDWIVGDYFIEFFGMPEKEYYKIRMEEKIEICKDNNIKLIALYKNDLNKLDEKLHILLQ